MEIVIEQLILTNFCLYLSFIIIVAYLLDFRLNKFKTFLSAILCGVSSLLFTLPYANQFLLVFFQIIMSLFALSFSYKNLKIKNLFQSYILFLFVSNIYYGILSTLSAKINTGILISSPISMVGCLALIFALSFLIKKSLKLVLNKQKSKQNICKIQLTYNGKTLDTNGYFDTGNNLTHNNAPVSIINFDLFSKLTGITLADYLGKKNCDYQFVNVATVTGEQKLVLLTLDELKLNLNSHQKIIHKPQVALSLKLVNNNYDVILNNNYI